MTVGPFPRLGISLSRGDREPVTSGELIEGAQRLEELGFHGIWLADSLARGYFTVDPLAGLAAIAAVTRRVELGTCILQLPLVEPVDLARRVLTVQLVARGRLVLGVGAGSTLRDFEAAGADFGARFRTFGERLDTIRALWRGETVGDVRLDVPAELAGGPPVLIGSWGGPWIGRAASEFDGWIGSGGKSGATADGSYPPAAWDRVAAAVARYRAGGGRRAVLASVVADLDADAPAGPDDPIHLRCPPDEARRRLARLAEIGFDDVVVVSVNQAPDHPEALAGLVA